MRVLLILMLILMRFELRGPKPIIALHALSSITSKHHLQPGPLPFPS